MGNGSGCLCGGEKNEIANELIDLKDGLTLQPLTSMVSAFALAPSPNETQRRAEENSRNTIY